MARLLTSTKEYRKAVDITAEEAKSVFEALPAQLLANPKTFYTKRVFKNAPAWPRAVRLIPVVNAILDATKGRAVHQKCLQTHFKTWLADQTGLDMSENDQDEIILSIRAVVCQLLNHKKNKRTVPVSHSRSFAVVWHKMQPDNTPDSTAPTGNHQEAQASDAESEDLQIVEPQQSEIEIIDLEFSEAGELIKHEDLFSSDVPELQEALKGTATGRKRLRSKVPDPSMPAIGLGVPDLASLVETSSNDIDPTTYREINKKLKEAHKKSKKCKTAGKAASKNRRKKNKKNEKNKKTKKDDANATGQVEKKKKKENPDEANLGKLDVAFVKREHSKAYAARKQKAKAEGKSEAEIKEAASIAGRKKTAELREQFKQGLIGSSGERLNASDVD